MLWSVLSRIERAADAFLSPVPAGPLRRPERKHIAEGAPGPPLPKLGDDERGQLQDQALGLLDEDVRGWLIVTVRDHCGGAEIDVDWRLPDAAWPAVAACLGEATAA